MLSMFCFCLKVNLPWSESLGRRGRRCTSGRTCSRLRLDRNTFVEVFAFDRLIVIVHVGGLPHVRIGARAVLLVALLYHRSVRRQRLLNSTLRLPSLSFLVLRVQSGICPSTDMARLIHRRLLFSQYRQSCVLYFWFSIE